MKLNYKVRLENPVKNALRVEDTLVKTGAVGVTVKSTGILVNAVVDNQGIVTKAHNYSYLGEDYSLNNNSQITMSTLDYYIVDVVSIFETIGKTTDSVEFKTIQPFIHSVVKSDDSKLKLSVYVEKETDVFVLKISNSGLISRLNYTIPSFSNTIILDQSETLTESDTLVYLLTNKPLKLDLDDYLFIPKQDVLKLPHGFCTLTNQVFSKNTVELSTEKTYSTLFSTVDTKLTFSSSLLVDTVLRQSYKIRANEKVILQTSQGFSKLSLNNLADNVTLIYEVMDDSSVQPYLAVVGKDIELEYNSNITNLLDELLQADEEFLKKYLFVEYKILISTPYNQHSIFDSTVLDKLQNTDEFLGRILKHE